ncbi:hypothetical protein OUZ56_001690 [Daphnia magna]|uniref:Uncharacterized protein n=1 Tax=Daphnia magna TaxID=35525 RepID=A0ABR0A3F5_9CRUS|nr:hypothetical protein OUZ56_001690 [Daphnia magna]
MDHEVGIISRLCTELDSMHSIGDNRITIKDGILIRNANKAVMSIAAYNLTDRLSLSFQKQQK